MNATEVLRTMAARVEGTPQRIPLTITGPSDAHRSGGYRLHCNATPLPINPNTTVGNGAAETACVWSWPIYPESETATGHSILLALAHLHNRHGQNSR